MTSKSAPLGEADLLRARAARCRASAREYENDVGASLSERAVELDLKADRLEAINNSAGLPAEAPRAIDDQAQRI